MYNTLMINNNVNGIGRVIGRKNNVARFLNGDKLNIVLCDWTGPGDYKGLVICRVHDDGRLLPYGDGRSKGHVMKLWNNFKVGRGN